MSAAILRRIARFVRSPMLAALAIGMSSAATPSHARSPFWSDSGFWWGDYQFRHEHRHRHTKSDSTKKHESQERSKGPLEIIISIADQRISLYENGSLIARSSVSTGIEHHPTPLGVFSVIGKTRWHRSNIYSDAPMPYMQRITWSGIALHAGVLPGHPASHGCIRLSNDFAIRLWHLTKRGTRVIISPKDVRPVEIANPQYFAQKPNVASASPDAGASTLANGTPTLANNDSVAAARTNAPLVSVTGEGAQASDLASAGAKSQASAETKPRKVVPISVFVSRQLGRLFVRRGFTPLFEVPITIRNPADPVGTHVFSVMESQNEDAAIRWTAVSIPEKPSLGADTANSALERIEIPQDVVDRIAPLVTPGSSLIISDHGISQETGSDTDFIVLTH